MLSKKWIGAIVAGSVVVGLFVVALSLYGYVSSLKTEGVRLEQTMSATYADNQNQLSAYIVAFHEQLGLTRERTAAGDSVLRNAIQGRYGPDGFKAQGSFFSAIAEAYPDLQSIVGGYDRVQQHVAAGRENFRNRQSILRDQIRSYETWMNEGLIRPSIIRMLGFPSTTMVARIGGTTVASGPAALNQFHQLVLDDQSIESFTAGRTAPLIGGTTN